MAIYGYHRTSTKEQHLDRGIQEIEDYCREHKLTLLTIFCDQLTGKNFDRPEYQFLKKRILPGDILITTELDRLGRNKQGILKELQHFKSIGVRVMVLELPTTLIDVSELSNDMAKMMIETINNMMIELYASMAEAEMQKKEKRQREGIAAKKARGDWDDYGRPVAIDQQEFDREFARVVDGKISPTDLRRELGLTHATFYRYRSRFYERNSNSAKK